MKAATVRRPKREKPPMRMFTITQALVEIERRSGFRFLEAGFRKWAELGLIPSHRNPGVGYHYWTSEQLDEIIVKYVPKVKLNGEKKIRWWKFPKEALEEIRKRTGRALSETTFRSWFKKGIYKMHRFPAKEPTQNRRRGGAQGYLTEDQIDRIISDLTRLSNS